MDPVAVSIHPERKVVRSDSISEIDIVVEVTCRAGSEQVDRRGPMNLCIVLDRSGSMQGAKLETAKKSAVDIYRRLSEDDLLTVVVFDDMTLVVVNPQTPASEVEGLLSGIATGGMTDLSRGWYQGLLELQTHMGELHRNRLILLSDGQANRGETKRSVFSDTASRAREVGISASTIGIGADFQEDLLEAISAASGGRFWNISDSDIEDIIEEEFQGALTVLIDRPRVALNLGRGLRISRELNSLRKVSDRYRMRPLQGEDTFNFAVRVEVDPTQIGDDGEAVISADLRDGDLPIATTGIRLSLGSVSEVAASPVHPLVRSTVQQFELTATDEVMIESVDGDKLSELRQMLTAEIAKLESVQSAWGEISARSFDLSESRMYFEIDHFGHNLDSKAVLHTILSMIEPYGTEPEVQGFLRLVRKNMRREGSRMKMRRLSRTPWDDEAPVIIEALALAEILADRYPSDAARIDEYRETLRERLENS